jgi:hypothetical protein
MEEYAAIGVDLIEAHVTSRRPNSLANLTSIEFED